MCDYCDGEWFALMGTGYKDIRVSMGKSVIADCFCIDLSYEVESGVTDSISTRIKYCPFCGRKLDD